MTKDSLLKMEMGKKFKVALTIPLVDIMKLSLSPDAGNQVVIIQLRGMLYRVWFQVGVSFGFGSRLGWVLVESGLVGSCLGLKFT